MHEGVNVAVKSMTQGEVANFSFARQRLNSESGLTRLLPSPKALKTHYKALQSCEDESQWQIEFQKFVCWEDLDRNGQRWAKHGMAWPLAQAWQAAEDPGGRLRGAGGGPQRGLRPLATFWPRQQVGSLHEVTFMFSLDSVQVHGEPGQWQ